MKTKSLTPNDVNDANDLSNYDPFEVEAAFPME